FLPGRAAPAFSSQYTAWRVEKQGGNGRYSVVSSGYQVGAGPPHPRFRFACASDWHRWAQIRPSPGGWERNMSLFETLWGFQPHTLSYFSLVRKVTKSTHRRGTLSTVSPS